MNNSPDPTLLTRFKRLLLYIGYQRVYFCLQSSSEKKYFIRSANLSSVIFALHFIVSVIYSDTTDLQQITIKQYVRSENGQIVIDIVIDSSSVHVLMKENIFIQP